MEFIRYRTVQALLGYRVFKVTKFCEDAEFLLRKIKSEGAENYGWSY
jgi:hypothetical protein